MIEGIVKAFKDNIEHVDWVDKDTVEAVEEKVQPSFTTLMELIQLALYSSWFALCHASVSS